MANRTFRDLQTLPVGVVVLEGSFQPNNTGAVTLPLGTGFTVARTGVGTYVVSLTDVYTSLLSASVDLQSSAASGNFGQLGAVDLPGKSITLRTVSSAGAAVDVTGGANDRVHFTLLLKNSSIKQ